MVERLLRLVWRLYPGGYRARFGEELERHIEELRSQGNASPTRLLVDALFTLARAWIDGLGRIPVVPSGLASGLGQILRGLARAPVYSLTVIAILALAIGANTAVFSVTHAVLFRSLPYRNPDQVVAVWPPPLALKGDTWGVDGDFASQVESAALYVEGGSANLAKDGSAQHVSLAQVTPDFFRVLGVEPLLGRDLSAPSTDGREVVLTHGLWVRAFGGDPSVVGRDVDLNGHAYTVVGVMPADVEFPSGVDLWLPFPLTGEYYANAAAPSGVARLRPGAGIAALTKIMNDRLQREYAGAPAAVEPPPARLTPLLDDLTAPVRTPLLLLLGIAGTVTLLGCLNLAGLVLARASVRADELGVRRALGASRPRLFGQLLGEVLILAAAAGLASLLAAIWTTRLLTSGLPGGLQGLDQVRLSMPVLAFAALLTFVAGLLVGALPALWGAATAYAAVGGTRTSTQGPGHVRLQGVLIVAQVALAFVLVAGAGLFGRSLARLRAVPLGYDLDHVLTFGVRLPTETYPDSASRSAYLDQLTNGLGAIPGVSAVGATTVLPPYQGVTVGVAVRPTGTPESHRVFATWLRATRGYLTAMGTPVVEGRVFPQDATGASRFEHVVLNRGLARRILGDGPAAGRTVLVQDYNEKWHEARVDAVVGDVHLRGATRTAPSFVLTDLAASPTSFPGFAVRSSGDPARLAQSIREVVKSVDPSVAPYDMRTTGEAAAQEIAARRALALLSAFFGVAALVVCALGLHGLVAQGVSRRRRELGVRLALGARVPALVRRTALAPLRLVAVGLLLGIPTVWILSDVSRSLLYEVAPHDPLVMTGVGVALVLLAVAAAWIPARRITRVDPAEALRAE